MIELDHLRRTFDVGGSTVLALDDVCLTIPQGEYVSIMGPSGSGKSTLLHILGLLDRPTSGTYRLDGADTHELPDEELARFRREKIGFVFQFFHLIARLSARENVELPLMLAGVESRERDRRVQAALEASLILDRAHHRPDQLSGGERQRVAIARATVMRPQVILADEPTGNLDQASGSEIVRVLENLNADGMTLIVVTHDPDVGGRARRHLRMVDGSIAGDTTHDGPLPDPDGPTT